MNDTLESLRHKIDRAVELGTVVRSMKALSASSINQYEQAVQSLEVYYRTVHLGLAVCFAKSSEWIKPGLNKSGKTGAIIFGSGQGLVGQFNDILGHFVKGHLDQIPGEKIIWAVGESIYTRLEDSGLPPAKQFDVPLSIQAITPLVGALLLDIEKAVANGDISAIYLFYNQPRTGAIYGPESLRFLPFDEVWLQEFSLKDWPTKKIPEVINSTGLTIMSLVREYLFVTLFRVCAKSLASENASRLAAMQRAEKNIKELLTNLNLAYHQLRQSSIDEELFDIISGAESLHLH